MEKRSDRRRTEPLPVSQDGPCQGSLRHSTPRKPALEINFKTHLLEPHCYQRVTLGDKEVSFPLAGK